MTVVRAIHPVSVRKLSTGILVEHHADHVLVEIDNTVARIDDCIVEGVSVVRRSHEDKLLAVEYRDEIGGISQLHLPWPASAATKAEDYCRRVSDSAAINVMDDFNENGLVQRSGYRFDDHELDCYPVDDTNIVAWQDITGVECIGDAIAIWTGENANATITIPSDAPNNSVLQRLIPPMAAARGTAATTKQFVGQLNCLRVHPFHPSILSFFFVGIFSAALLKGGQLHNSIFLTAAGLIACLPLFLYLINKLSKRPATLQLYRNCLVLKVGRKCVEIPWIELARLSVNGEFEQRIAGSKRSRRIHLNVRHRILRDPMYLLIRPNGQELKTIAWIRERAKRQRLAQMLVTDHVPDR